MDIEYVTKSTTVDTPLKPTNVHSQQGYSPSNNHDYKDTLDVYRIARNFRGA